MVRVLRMFMKMVKLISTSATCKGFNVVGGL